jgi:hypothetical protein
LPAGFREKFLAKANLSSKSILSDWISLMAPEDSYKYWRIRDPTAEMISVGETSRGKKRIFPVKNLSSFGVASGFQGIHDELGFIVS